MQGKTVFFRLGRAAVGGNKFLILLVQNLSFHGPYRRATSEPLVTWLTAACCLLVRCGPWALLENINTWSIPGPISLGLAISGRTDGKDIESACARAQNSTFGRIGRGVFGLEDTCARYLGRCFASLDAMHLISGPHTRASVMKQMKKYGWAVGLKVDGGEAVVDGKLVEPWPRRAWRVPVLLSRKHI